MSIVNDKLKVINKAIRQGDLDLIKSNLDYDDEALNARVALGTWLHTAASRGQIEVVKYLMDRGLSVNVKCDLSGQKAICKAAARGHSDIVDLFLSNGVEIDVSHPMVNPLFSAIIGSHSRIVKTLIDTGMNTKIRYTTETMVDMDALDFAKEYECLEIIEMLKKSKGISK